MAFAAAFSGETLEDGRLVKGSVLLHMAVEYGAP